MGDGRLVRTMSASPPVAAPPRYGARFVVRRARSGVSGEFEAWIATPEETTCHRVTVTGAGVQVEPTRDDWAGRELEKLARAMVRAGRPSGKWWRAPRPARGG